MKITLPAKELACVLKSAALLVESRTTIPILSHVVIEANDSGVQLRTTDTDMWFVGKLASGNLTVHEAGIVTAPVKALLTVLSDVDGLVELESGSKDIPSLTVRFGRSSIKLSGLHPADFPNPFEKKRPCVFELAAGDLRTLIDKTRRAISTEETRYYLNGLYLHAAGNPKDPRSLSIVATDGHRLAKADMPMPVVSAKIPGVIIPRLTVNVLRRLIDKTDEPVKVELSDDHGACLRFSSGSWSLVSKDIDGTFPDYEQVIPKGNENHVGIVKDALLRTLKQVGKITGKGRDILRFDINQNSIEVLGWTEDGDTVSTSIDCLSNLTMEIGLNWRYVLDAIDVMDGDSVMIDIAKNTDPVVIRDPADAGYLAVVMPARV